VSLRRREVGLRVALGAQHGDIAWQFLGKAISVVGLAGVAGIAGALAFSGLLSGMLFGVPPNDPATLGAALGLVVLVASIAALVPALRASRIDPMVALREE
jgi:putative ABC transport system permease protein